MTNRKGQEWTGTEKLFCVCKNQHQKYITAPRGLHFCTKKAALADCRNFSKKNGGGGWIRTIEGMAGRFTVYCI